MSGINNAEAGKVALVTGAGHGIGRETAIVLAESGYRVGLVDKSPTGLAATAELIERSGGEVVAVTGDVSDPSAVERSCDATTQRFGTIDVLVNNAGEPGQFSAFVETDPAVWWQVQMTNVCGPMLFCHRVLPAMLAQGRGFVINVNSRIAVRDDTAAACSAYAVSKAALSRLTSALAHELAGSGVVVLDFSPGMVRTAMTEQRPDYDALPDKIFTPARVPAQKIAALASGRYDVLHGRLVHVHDDLDQLAKHVVENPRARVLTVHTTGLDDPFQ
ncbi:SDR family NAD(P)-dependent oxidoreductase [Streptomyces sp. NPDC002586]